MTPGVFAAILSGYDAAVHDWRARVRANGGTASPRTLRATSDFCKGLKAAGIWNKINRINLFAGDQLASCLVPLKVGGGSATDTNVNFVAGDYTEATGLTPNGTTKYLNTGLTPAAAMTTTSGSLWFYAGTAAVPGALNVLIGASEAAGVNPTYIIDDAGTTVRGAIASSYAGAAIATATSLGFLGASVDGSRVQVFYSNGVQTGTTPVAAGVLAAFPFFVFGLNPGGAAPTYSPENGRAYAIAAGFSAADAAAFNRIMQTFQSALGRAV